MTDNSSKKSDFIERRRQLLKLGAAGVPMVLTLKASATQAVHSALDCAFVLSESVTILVSYEGAAWIGDGNIRSKRGKLKSQDVESFKQNADYTFPAGTVPARYRPDECSSSGGDDDSDCGWGNDIEDPLGDNDDQDSCDADPNRETPWFEEDDQDGEPGNRDHGWRGRGRGDDDDDDDDSGGGGWTDCYAVYTVGRNTTITPADYLSNSGSWNLSGEKGLYLLLAGKYLDSYGNDGGFPGISCLFSILNYLETQ